MIIARFLHSSRRVALDIKQQLLDLNSLHVESLPFRKIIDVASQTYKSPVPTDHSKLPLVMIHGLFGAKQNYAMVGRTIAEKTSRQVIGLDMRNHGGSDHVLPHDYIHMAIDTEKYLRQLGKPAILAGHLMGAKVAMLVALNWPELVEKLVVIDNSPVASALDSQFTQDLRAMCHVKLDSELAKVKLKNLRIEVDRVMQDYEKDPMVRLFLISNLKPRASSTDTLPIDFRVPVMSFLKYGVLEKMGEWPATEVQGLRFEKPVLLLRGLHSPFVPDLKVFDEYFQDIHVVDYDSGHWLVSERPKKFVADMIEFIED